MNSRTPPRGTTEYFQFLEEWCLKERVDNDRQWRELRGLEAATAGLDPVISIVSLTIPAGAGSGSGSGGA